MIKILVAEDEPLSRQTLINHLRRCLGTNALIEGAANGREAVELAEQLAPQLIFLDIEMPVLNGLDAASILRGKGVKARIVFLTAFDRFDYAVGAIRAGGDDYLLKPFDNAEISACLRATFPEMGEESPVSAKTPFQAQFSAWLQNHYTEDISLEQAAESMNMSTFYFSRMFRAAYNQTFVEYLTAYRLTRAVELLRSTDIPVRDIAPRVGYADPNYFSKVFKRQNGVTPTEYRQQHKAF